MWISIGVDKLVVDSMIANPSQHRLLTRHCLKEKQAALHESSRPERSMGKKSMGSNGCSISNRNSQHDLHDIRRLHSRWVKECVNGENMQIQESDDIAPFENDFVFRLVAFQILIISISNWNKETHQSRPRILQKTFLWRKLRGSRVRFTLQNRVIWISFLGLALKIFDIYKEKSLTIASPDRTFFFFSEINSCDVFATSVWW